MPELTPGSVDQLLGVLKRTEHNHLKQGAAVSTAYQDAVRVVAQQHGVTYQTIGDLCRRRLGLRDIDEFYKLLRQWLSGDADPLRRRVLKYAAADSHPAIRGFFKNGGPRPERTARAESEGDPGSAPASQDLSLRIGSDLMQRLRLAHLAGIGATLEDTVIALLEKGFEAERPKVRRYLDDAVG